MSVLFNLFRYKVTCVPVIYRSSFITNNLLQNTCRLFVPDTKFYYTCTSAASKLLLSSDSKTILGDKQCRSITWKLFSYKNPDHSSHWIVERYSSFLLIFVFPAAFYYQTETLDMLLSVLTSYHLYLGLDAVVQDYIRETVFGSVIPKISRAIILISFVALLYGLLLITFTDMGLTATISAMWRAL